MANHLSGRLSWHRSLGSRPVHRFDVPQHGMIHDSSLRLGRSTSRSRRFAIPDVDKAESKVVERRRGARHGRGCLAQRPSGCGSLPWLMREEGRSPLLLRHATSLWPVATSNRPAPGWPGPGQRHVHLKRAYSLRGGHARRHEDALAIEPARRCGCDVGLHRDLQALVRADADLVDMPHAGGAREAAGGDGTKIEDAISLEVAWYDPFDAAHHAHLGTA